MDAHVLHHKVKRPMGDGPLPKKCGKLVFVVNVLVNVMTSLMHTSHGQLACT